MLCIEEVADNSQLNTLPLDKEDAWFSIIPSRSMTTIRQTLHVQQNNDPMLGHRLRR